MKKDKIKPEDNDLRPSTTRRYFKGGGARQVSGALQGRDKPRSAITGRSGSIPDG